MSKIHLEIFDKERLEVFRKLKTFRKLGVLAGGTAIALQIKHRKSFDFDVFIKTRISDYLRQKARKTLGYTSQIIKDQTNQLDIITPETIKVTFVKHPYPPLHSLVNTESIKLFGLHDLASNKAYTIGRRGTWRDYVDLFFLLKEKYTPLDSIIKEATRRFGGEFNQRLFLEQLVYTKDIVDFGIDFLREEYEPNEIVRYFIKITKEYKKTKL
ncbi:nucleotidyl transferase AbiEii/AbiGii toxin family protein [Patescibacteria group bacterium]|nr:nucleotidyl transferase AbiEii/AbiGii toxin family protein [Patescibacteria group bacterium]